MDPASVITALRKYVTGSIGAAATSVAITAVVTVFDIAAFCALFKPPGK